MQELLSSQPKVDVKYKRTDEWERLGLKMVSDNEEEKPEYYILIRHNYEVMQS